MRSLANCKRLEDFLPWLAEECLSKISIQLILSIVQWTQTKRQPIADPSADVPVLLAEGVDKPCAPNVALNISSALKEP